MDGDTPYNIMFGKFSCLELINAQETSLVLSETELPKVTHGNVFKAFKQ
jgi:hypothetical protein